MAVKKTRLDVLLVERGLADSRSLAQRLVMAGQVRVNGEVVLRSAANITPDARLEVERGPRFVSRGGEKLEAALQAFNVDVGGAVCADVGASTGGFTDCLLQHGAQRVYAIDVGQGILDWKLRIDKRVVVMEGTNARHLERLDEPVDLVTIDASFISLKVLLPVVKGWFSPPGGDGQSHVGRPTLDRTSRGRPTLDRTSRGRVIPLIKPQFEAGRRLVGRGKGVIRDAAIHRQVLLDVLAYARGEGYTAAGLIRSPLTGPKGNVEFLALLTCGDGQGSDLESLVQAVLPEEP